MAKDLYNIEKLDLPDITSVKNGLENVGGSVATKLSNSLNSIGQLSSSSRSQQFPSSIGSDLSPDKFSSEIDLNKGLARENRFVLKIITPQKMTGVMSGPNGGGRKFEDLSIFCDECEFPSSSLNTISYQDNHASLTAVNGYTNKDVKVSFIVPQNYFVKELLNNWHKLIINKPSYRASYKDDYVTTVFIAQLNERYLPVHGVTLKRAYPSYVDGIKFSSSRDNTFVRVSLSFKYDDFEEKNLIYPYDGIDPSIFTLSDIKNGLNFLDDLVYNYQAKLNQKFDKKFFELQDKLKSIPVVGEALNEILGIDGLRESILGTGNDIFGTVTDVVKSPFEDAIFSIQDTISGARTDLYDYGSAQISSGYEGVKSFVKDDLFGFGSSETNGTNDSNQTGGIFTSITSSASKGLSDLYNFF